VSWFVLLLPYLERKDLYDLWAAGDTNDATYRNNASRLLKIGVCPSDPSAAMGQGDTPLSYVVNRGVNGKNNPALGVCMDQYSMATPAVVGYTGSSVRMTRVGVDYISGHDGASTTLLLAECLLTPDGVTTFSGASNDVPEPRLYLNAMTGTSGTIYFARPKSSWAIIPKTASPYVMDWDGKAASLNKAEIELAFDWLLFPTTAAAGKDSRQVSDKIVSRHGGTVNVGFCDGHQTSLSDTVDADVFRQLMTPWGNGVAAALSATPAMTPSPTWTGNLPVLDESAY
jgi:prepilin-type processing-associated H-X9-DG protein